MELISQNQLVTVITLLTCCGEKSEYLYSFQPPITDLQTVVVLRSAPVSSSNDASLSSFHLGFLCVVLFFP